MTRFESVVTARRCDFEQKLLQARAAIARYGAEHSRTPHHRRMAAMYSDLLAALQRHGEAAG